MTDYMQPIIEKHLRRVSNEYYLLGTAFGLVAGFGFGLMVGLGW